MAKSSKKQTRPTRKLGLPPGSLIHIGEIKTEKPSITLIEFDAHGAIREHPSTAQIREQIEERLRGR